MTNMGNVYENLPHSVHNVSINVSEAQLEKDRVEKIRLGSTRMVGEDENSSRSRVCVVVTW